MLLQYSYKELRNDKKFFLIFILTLSLGLTGLTLLDQLKGSFNSAISKRAKALIGSDLTLSSRRPFRKTDLEIAKSVLKNKIEDQSTVNELFTMMRFSGKTRLVELRVLESNFPFYGQIVTENETITGRNDLSQKQQVWLSQELVKQFNITKGKRVNLGAESFEFTKIVLDDSASSWRGISLAPKVYISKKFIKDTKLIRVGSSVFYSKRFKLKKEFQDRDSISSIVEQLNQKITEPGVRVRGPEEASEQVGRVFQYLADFLGLVALSALLLAAIGCVYLFRSFITNKIKDVAILKELGQEHSWIKNKFVIQLFILAISSSLLTLLTSFLIYLPLSSFLSDYANVQMEWSFARTLISSLVVAILTSLCSCYPLLSSLVDIKASDLFRETPLKEVRLGASKLKGYGLSLVVFYLLSFYQVKSFKISILYFFIFLISFVVLYFISSWVLNYFKDRSSKKEMSLSNFLSLKYLTQNKLSTITTYMALSIGVMVLILIGQIEKDLTRELVFDQTKSRPQLFLFDIQEEQVEELKTVVSKQGDHLKALSPMVRARLSKINGEVYKKKEKKELETREEQRSRRFSNRGINLTYRSELTESETLVEGTFYSGSYDPSSGNLPEISIEKRYANRMGVGLGDTMSFDILGVEIEGKITSIRQIKWTSFMPNFFIQFQPGAIDMAPKTYLAALSNLDQNKKDILQSMIVENLNNISIVDVTVVVKKILVIFQQMSLALKLMGLTCILIGLLVLLSIIIHQVNERRRDISLMKVLGVTHNEISLIILREYLTIILASVISGSLLGFGSGFIVSELFFDGNFSLNLKIFIQLFFLVMIFGLMVVKIGSHNILSKPSLKFIN